jgi:hypothetical protein
MTQSGHRAAGSQTAEKRPEARDNSNIYAFPAMQRYVQSRGERMFVPRIKIDVSDLNRKSRLFANEGGITR